MPRPSPLLPLLVLVSLATPACTRHACRSRALPTASTRAASPVPAAPAAPAVPRPASVLRDGATGAAVGPEAWARLVAGADVVAFGEFHEDPEGSRAEGALWDALLGAADGRPATLALEFFEKDTQGDLDAYLAGALAKPDFVKRTRQGPAYEKTHGPLVEAAKAHGRAVLAANAPRRLVTAYRKQAEAYEDWKAALPEADRAALPRSTSTPEGPYRERFVSLMGQERGAAFFKAQSLWDDAMAESVADARTAHPDARVLLVVGGFHVQERLGTLAKIAQRRPEDRLALVVMAHGDGPDLALPADAQGTADLVLVVPRPPPEPPAPAPKVRP